jgi:hypothetical protein
MRTAPLVTATALLAVAAAPFAAAAQATALGPDGGRAGHSLTMTVLDVSVSR